MLLQSKQKTIMKIRCKTPGCGHTEKTNLELFIKILGGALPMGGFQAWRYYLFAGTGFALTIVTAIITGGIALLVFKDEIVTWIVNRGYKCPCCESVDWEA